jgi:murein DD-endopeptidase MepM/ murein hydrolase activator NlpD
MKTAHVIYLIVIFLLIGYIGSQRSSFITASNMRIKTLDSLSLELDTLKAVHNGLCNAIDNIPLKAPLKTIVIDDKFGWRRDPFTKRGRFHAGLDFKGSHKDTVYTPANGIVLKANWNAGYGRCVVIQHADGYETLYAHLSRIFVAVGDSVHVREPIGKIGSTGRSTGSHLHYEIIRNGKKLDPCGFLDPTLNNGCE